MCGGGTEACPRVISVNASDRKHVPKRPVAEAELRPDFGVVGDSHAGAGDRQVSLLAMEAIERMRLKLAEAAKGGRAAKCPKAGDFLSPGSFAENITTIGLDISSLPIGTRIRIGEEAVIEISVIGKECHQHCAIRKMVGDCVMPREGVFARVIKGGKVRPGDELHVEENGGHPGN
jgi:cyclic pyranopterin phosphate synthase